MNTVASKLLSQNILSSEGFSCFQQEIQRLKTFRQNTSWKIEIDRETPISFEAVKDENKKWIHPSISCKEICVDQSQQNTPPFTSLDVALEIRDEQSKLLSRWHIDWANTTNGKIQSGPLTHLQFGGHTPNQEDEDHPIKVPRWLHPPMDIPLLCEMVAANFYESKWVDLRDDANWCKAICDSQKLCYSAYSLRMSICFSKSSQTILHSMWASEWLD